MRNGRHVFGRARFGAVVSAILMMGGAGCQKPPEPRIVEFIPKPAVAPSSARTFEEVTSAYGLRGDSTDSEWTGMIASATDDMQSAFLDEQPVPATTWYEFLRSGQDFTSRVDVVLRADYASFKELTVSDEPDAALRHLLAGSVAFEAGMYGTAQAHFRKAVYWMEDASDTDRETQALFGRGDVKIYKGDAYERTMVHFYLGLIAYSRGDFEDARREFFRALRADEGKPADAERGRFGLIHYWVGKTYARLGDHDNLRVSCEKGTTSPVPEGGKPLFSQELIENSNLTVVVQLGTGACRVPKGADWQVTKYEQCAYPERVCEILIDDQPVGTAACIADLWDQISRQGVSEEEELQQSKVVVKAVVQALPYINILGVAWDVTGDMRSWALLPDQIHIWSGKVSPGEHTVTLKFYGEDDCELVRFRQTWYYVPTDDSRDQLIVARSGRDRCSLNRNEG